LAYNFEILNTKERSDLCILATKFFGNFLNFANKTLSCFIKYSKTWQLEK